MLSLRTAAPGAGAGVLAEARPPTELQRRIDGLVQSSEIALEKEGASALLRRRARARAWRG